MRAMPGMTLLSLLLVLPLLPSLAYAGAGCANPTYLPQCAKLTSATEAPMFDVTNSCDYAVSVGLRHADLPYDIVFNLSESQTMSETILSEIPAQDLEVLTRGASDETLSVDCCPEFSQFTRCADTQDDK